jgi:hypothetical protein
VVVDRLPRTQYSEPGFVSWLRRAAEWLMRVAGYGLWLFPALFVGRCVVWAYRMVTGDRPSPEELCHFVSSDGFPDWNRVTTPDGSRVFYTNPPYGDSGHNVCEPGPNFGFGHTLWNGRWMALWLFGLLVAVLVMAIVASLVAAGIEAGSQEKFEAERDRLIDKAQTAHYAVENLVYVPVPTAESRGRARATPPRPGLTATVWLFESEPGAEPVDIAFSPGDCFWMSVEGDGTTAIFPDANYNYITGKHGFGRRIVLCSRTNDHDLPRYRTAAEAAAALEARRAKVLAQYAPRTA